MSNHDNQQTQVPSATREAILAVEDTPCEQVTVPQWGLTVWVRTMTAQERDRLESRMVSKNGKADATKAMNNFRAHLAVASVVDDNGAPMFTTDDVPALANKSAGALDVLAEAATRLSGISNKDVEQIVGE